MARKRPHIVLPPSHANCRCVSVEEPEAPYPFERAKLVIVELFHKLTLMLMERRLVVRAEFVGELFVALESVVGSIGPDTLQAGIDKLEAWLDDKACYGLLNESEEEVLAFARVLLEDVQVFDATWRLGGVR